jgi:hypothetical protein
MTTKIQPIIRILFYAPGTGFSTQITGVPFTIAHKSAGDNEIAKFKQMQGVTFDIDKFFTNRGVITDNRQIPGFITLVDSTNDITDPNNEQVFDTQTGGTAGHLYQRLIEHNLAAKRMNKNKTQNKQTPLYSIYTIIDKPNDSTNLHFLLEHMHSAGYPNNFFDVCITASKGIDQLLPHVNKHNIDTNLVLINGASSGYMNKNLTKGSKVRAVILTHGGNDNQIINQNRVNSFLNGNSTKLFIYSNKYDGHIQASLILGDTNKLHISLMKKTNRNFKYSLLPILVNSVYYAGQPNSDWSFLLSFLSKEDKFVNINTNLMVGGGRPNGRSYCGCSGSTTSPNTMPILLPAIDINNNDDFNPQYGGYKTMVELYCECDRKSEYDIERELNVSTKTLFRNIFGDDYKSTFPQYTYESLTMVGGKKHNDINNNDNDYLYPDINISPFSNIDESDEPEYNTDNQTEQTGGNMMDYMDSYIVGSTISELKYLSARNDYLKIRKM